jgi:23S rRNA (cytidine1920-2'-O)/16S rRNA (cytidine1409-2'-O)-methyltransferase
MACKNGVREFRQEENQTPQPAILAPSEPSQNATLKLTQNRPETCGVVPALNAGLHLIGHRNGSQQLTGACKRPAPLATCNAAPHFTRARPPNSMPPPSPPKERLDQTLVLRQLCDSREQAKRLILAGEVKVDGHVVDKPATKIGSDSAIILKSRPRYVGRGGLKLEGALSSLGINPAELTCLDIGASTGGFTDCLLQHGATKVYTIDVGTNQLVWKIRSDPRVISREKFNARNLSATDLPEAMDLIVIDVSFISLTKILPAAFSVLKPDGHIVALIKPQFEVGRNEVGKGGIVRDETARERAADRITEFVSSTLAQRSIRRIDSPITGTDGNHEYFGHFRPQGDY